MGLLRSKSRFEQAKERASHKVGPVAEQVKDRVGPAVGTARDKVTPYAEKAVEKGASAASHAVDRVAPVIDEALGKVGPAAEHAAEKARERFNDDVLPKVSAALSALAAAAEPAVEETARRGRATKAALKGEIDVPKKRHRLRKVVVFLGIGAAAAAVARKLFSAPEPAWQSTPTSGRAYSSAPTTEPKHAADTEPKKPEAKPADAKPETAKVDPEPKKAQSKKAEPKAETAKAETDETLPGANGTGKTTAKKATSSTARRRSNGNPNSKPSES